MIYYIKMRKLVCLLVLTGVWASAQPAPKGPTDTEKLSISQLVRQYLQQKQTAIDAQIKASTLAQQIDMKRNEVEQKYKCTYNFDTDECVPVAPKESK